MPKHLQGTLEQGEAAWLKREISYLRQELKIERAGNKMLLERIRHLEEAFNFKFGKAEMTMDKKIIEKAMGFHEMPHQVKKDEDRVLKQRPKTDVLKYHNQLKKDRERFDGQGK